MKKRNIILISIVLFLFLGVITGVLILSKNNNKVIEKKLNKTSDKSIIRKRECTPISGGSFNLIFDTAGGDSIDSMSICISCNPDSYKDIPIPTKDGYKFLGWYTDREYTNMITSTNTKDFKSVPKYDDYKCMIGYEDMTIHAKWIEDVPKEDSVVPKPLEENQTQTTPVTTKVYRPANSFYVLRGFGQVDSATHKTCFDVLLKLSSDRILYPINDGVFLGMKNRASHEYDYTYILYKTNINGSNWYVLYYSYFYLNPSRDFSLSRNISYNEPLVFMELDPRLTAAVPGAFHVKMVPATYDYNFEINNYNKIANDIIGKEVYNQLNLNNLFNITQGESYNER